MTTTSNRSEKADAVTVMFLSAAALVIVGIATQLRILSTFRDVGIAWSIPIDEQPISATTNSGAVTIEGIAQHAMVFATDVNPVSVAAIIGAIALWAVAAVVVIGAVALVAWNLLRGRVFVPGNARAFDAIGWTLAAAPVLIVILETMGRNGVTAALGIGAGEPVHPLEFWSVLPIFGAGVATGLIAVAFRRGIRMRQEKDLLAKDTEGLV
ncbi:MULTISPECIES: DUF2975 domain-containing protein [unclassified Microbacterium]|uniref:DUF2975 domain-containing protein n=1 Tax=unclassified Microbacterium TaxID=2609290 RepID=UPI000EAAA78B|nr:MULTISPECIES: DUF2975 domain-containing protein [unclassified Microbacterium]MBT2483577.1 DUF2975 domain-containing protein [Microbacterium sp. ISL-108]RKN66588.1 DUF2975 domain-containing protein [Microbacterium sp. CGR2]